MSDGIRITAFGACTPFSKAGKSTGYQVSIGASSYLVDCGTPLFHEIGGHGLKLIKGLIITHCHEDHKRWFSDLALFNMYVPDTSGKIFLLTSEDVHNEILKSSGAALDRTLSSDGDAIIDVPYDDYVDFHMLGPRAKFSIASRDEGEGRVALYVSDLQGNKVGPDKAKIVISLKTNRPRLLFRDPRCNEWVEPESFYPYSSEIFYEKNQKIYDDSEGFSIEAIKSPVWHGVSGIGLKFHTTSESVIFSSDTAHDKRLWERLYTKKRPQKINTPIEKFESASVLYGDINDYIERTWSEERYIDAINTFKDSIVVHDIALKNSVIHTDYANLHHTVLIKERTLLTHTPDRITSEWALSKIDLTYLIKGNVFYEFLDDKPCPIDADIYHKDSGRYFVGYKNVEGACLVYENNNLLHLSTEENPELGTFLFRVDLYEDIGGKYFPIIQNSNSAYHLRMDGQVELVEFSEEGSTGKIVQDMRSALFKKR